MTLQPPPDARWFITEPDPGHYFHRGSVPVARPIVQGDVFRSVPIVLARVPGDPGAARRQMAKRAVLVEPFPMNLDEAARAIRVQFRMAMLLPHTCEFYEKQAGQTNPLRVVALVRERGGQNIRPDWQGNYNLLPLPNLLRDNVDYVAQLDHISTIEEALLPKQNRMAALSFHGWLALHQRVNHFFTRTYSPWIELEAGHRPLWDEVARDEAEAAAG